MTHGYSIDLERFSLERFRYLLETGELLPARQVLKESISERFSILESMGISNLKELIDVLKTPQRIQRFSQASGLPEDYLLILRREANSYTPKPVKLEDLPGVSPETLERLAAVGVKNTRHLYERAISESDLADLSKLTDVPVDDLLELAKLSDLARVGGVGPVFARMLYEAGVDTSASLLEHSPDELLEKLHQINQEKGYITVTLSAKDVAYCIGKARELAQAIED